MKETLAYNNKGGVVREGGLDQCLVDTEGREVTTEEQGEREPKSVWSSQAGTSGGGAD